MMIRDMGKKTKNKIRKKLLCALVIFVLFFENPSLMPFVSGIVSDILPGEVYAQPSENTVSADEVFLSNLPVIYINTCDGQDITSKEEYVSGNMVIQNNPESDVVYAGGIRIKGRGNSSWGWPKKPYRIKLDKKADLFGMGKNKNWVLLANYLDESLLRNTTAFQISEELGLVSVQSVWTDVVLNGDYIGNYQLCEQIRIDEDRVDIFDWEAEAKKAAEAVAGKESEGFDKDSFEIFLNKDLSWITSGETVYNGKNYTIKDYYPDVCTDTSGGYLFELSREYDEMSKFTTREGLKVMVRSPEYLYTNPDMTEYVTGLWNCFEEALRSEDGYADAGGARKHYTEIADIDTMAAFWLTMEIMGNDDAEAKSRFVYKDVDDIIKFGPVWDFDWGCGSLAVGTDATGWKISKSNSLQAFYKEMLDDPLFICEATEKYWQIRPFLGELVRAGGILDSETDYLRISGNADAERWDRHITWNNKARGFENDAAAFKTYMTERIEWLDKQFATDEALLESIYTEDSACPYVKADEMLDIETPNAVDDVFSEHAPADCIIRKGNDLTLDVSVNDGSTTLLNVYVNGIDYACIDTDDGKARLEVPSDRLNATAGSKNVISLIGKNSDGVTTYRNFVTVIEKEFGEKVKCHVFSSMRYERTADEPGYYIYTCTICGYSYRVDDTYESGSDAHKTDGKVVRLINKDHAKYSYDEKTDTLIASVKTDISSRFKNVKNSNEYVKKAKHRYTVSDKKIATISNKGVIKPRNSGEVDVYLEQKVKGGEWTRLAAVHLYVQKPSMKSKDTLVAVAGAKINAYQYLSHTTYSPTKWKVSKSSVAIIDEDGVITVKKSGKVKIMAVYGKGKNKKTYTTVLSLHL